MAKKGNQKPTTCYKLKYVKKRSKAFEAIESYGSTGNALIKWQENLLMDIMAVDKKGLWVHTKCGYSLPRRNGKSEILLAREKWGLEHGEKIMHTAQLADTSHDAWEKLVRLLILAGYEEGTDFHSTKAKGSETIEMLTGSGGFIKYRTRTTTGGLGEGVDLLVVDEAQEFTDAQESALKYTVSSSEHPQTIMCGTPPTAYSKGTVFLKFRNQTLKGERKNSWWAEWGVEKKSDVHDVSLWYLTNPSLGYHLSERDVEDEIGDDDIDFNIQRLGLWLQYAQDSAIKLVDWQKLQIKTKPALKGRLFAGIKYGRDGKNVSLSIAAKTEDEKVFVETIDSRPIFQGTDWLIEFLSRADVERVVVDGATGQRMLMDAMKDARLKKPELPTVAQIIDANNLFTVGVFSDQICHSGQKGLMESATNVEKRAIGSNGGFGYRSLKDSVDVSILDSAILAYWGCAKAKQKKPQQVFY